VQSLHSSALTEGATKPAVSLSIAAYAFLIAQRLELSPMDAIRQSHSDEAAEEKNQPAPPPYRRKPVAID